MTAALLQLLTSLLLLVLIFVPLERSLPARRLPLLRSAIGTDFLFFVGQNILFASVAVAALSWFSAAVHRHVPIPAVPLPAWLLAVVAVVAGDFLAYWGHRLQHAWPALWRFHAVHHTARDLDWLAAHREHPLDGLYTQTLINLPAILLGFQFGGAMGLVAFRSLYAIFIHANTSLSPGALTGSLLGAPGLHRVHHRLAGPTRNFGNLSPYWDVLFHTHEAPSDADVDLGIEEAHPTAYTELLLWPFRR